ncbi:UNVERIFIED_CONTAM: hypothetical protein H355_011646 [Colinus virginianus]|nr:hypothetical protein H355_011646 [Colinus virginianus]
MEEWGFLTVYRHLCGIQDVYIKCIGFMCLFLSIGYGETEVDEMLMIFEVKLVMCTSNNVECPRLVWIYEESKMNLEQERPFVCSAPGCSQRFPTEDHLMIHRHKHEMTLKFPSIKTDNMLSGFAKCYYPDHVMFVVSDQTPTPTRFLKNCEEVGLFNDIDCSLEHEFRKAQEEENNKRNISMHNTVGGAMAGPGSHQLTNTRMPNHDTSVVIQQAMPSPQSSSVITQAPSTNRQIG